MRVVASLAVVVALAGCGSESPSKQAEELASLAAEGALVAHDVAEGDTTGAFVDVHAGELASAAESLSTSSDSTSLRRLAARVAAMLDDLREADAREARGLERRLERASAEVESLP